VLPKKYMLLKKGELHIEVLPRICTDNIDYQELCKETRKMYKEKYSELCKEVETPNYYADEIINNYIYKGKDVLNAVRKSLAMNDNYKELISAVPETGNVLLRNVGMGEVSLLMALVRKNANFTAIIEDEEKYLTANNCASIPKNLIYSQEVNEEELFNYIIDCHGE